MFTIRFALPFSIQLGLFVAFLPYITDLLRSSTYVSFFILAVTVWLILGSIRYLRNAASLRFSGPIPFPLFGNCLSLIEKGNLQESLRSLVETHGNLTDLTVTRGKRYVMVNDPSFCMAAFRSKDRGDVTKNWRTDFVESFLWCNMLGFKDLDLFGRTDEILDWNGHRKMLRRAFDQQHVRALTLKIQGAVQQLVDNLPDDKTVDIVPFFKDYGLEMIHRAALGQTVSTLDDRGAFLLHFLGSLGQQFSDYIFDPFLYINVMILPRLGLNPKELQRRKDVPIFRQYCRSLIEKEQEKLRKDGYCDDAAVDNLLSIMVAAINDDTFDSENVIDELTEFLFAGYDTSAITLSNLVHHLATNQSVQETLHREIDSVAYDGNYAELIKEMPYLSACLRESQRLQPIAPLLLRRLQEDVPFKQGESSVVIPSGTPVFIPVFLLHRDEKQYPDPESFLPERWLTKNGSLIPPKPGYYFAYGGGPKMCIGFQLADKEVKMAAAAVLKEFCIFSRGDVKIVDNFVTGPEQVLVELKRRS